MRRIRKIVKNEKHIKKEAFRAITFSIELESRSQKADISDRSWNFIFVRECAFS